jgi:hypothetical protein
MGAGPEKAPETVEFGEKLEKPEDPEVEGYKFLGWFSDEALTTEFDFDCPIIANTTIYGGFEESSGVSYTVTFNPNFTGAVKQFVEVDEGDALVPAKVGNPGYYLEGWFTAGGDEIDFSTYEVTEDVELYAHWTEPTSYYEFTVGVANKRIAFRYSDDSEHYLGIAPKKGDTITFKYRVPEGKNFNKLYLRDFAGSSGSKFADGSDSSWAVATVSGPDDGWYSFSVTFDKLQSGAAYEFPVPGFLLELRYDGGFVVGDIIEVMGFAYNGEELEITDDYHMGIRTNEGADNAKDDTKPTMKIIPIGE